MKVIDFEKKKDEVKLENHLISVHQGLSEHLDVDVKGLVVAILTADDEIIQVCTSLSDLEKVGLLDAAKFNFMAYGD